MADDSTKKDVNENTENTEIREDNEVRLNDDLAKIIDNKLDEIEDADRDSFSDKKAKADADKANESVTDEAADKPDSKPDNIPDSKTDDEKSVQADSNKSQAALDSVNNKKPKTGLIIVLCILAAALVGGGAYYVYAAQKYADRYLPGTIINGINAEGMTADEVKARLTEQSEEYVLNLLSRGRANETITSEDVGLHYVTDTAPDDILNSQNKYAWLKGRFNNTDYKVTTTAQVDEDKFNSCVDALPCFDDSTAVEPVEEHISEFDENYGYVVIPSTTGNFLADKEQAKADIKNAILTLTPEFDLEEGDGHLYAVPVPEEGDPVLADICDELNNFCQADIEYEGYDLKVNGAIIKNWLIVDRHADPMVTFDHDKLKDFVSFVAATYDTVGKPHLFHSTYGADVMTEPGTYGWEVDQDKEALELYDAVMSGYKGERRPVFKKEAATFGETEYGDTYVEVNLTAQHVYVYKDGKLLLHSDCVSGKDTKDRRTVEGMYTVYAKQRDRTLRGLQRPDGTYEYESHVNFWMPFFQGYGLHDATWRGSFGGTIWKYSGSHGCVNLPYKVAKQLYEIIEVGCPVITYKLEGTMGEAENAPEVETTEAPSTEAPKPTKAPAPKKTTPTQPATQPAVIPETTAPQIIPVTPGTTPPAAPGTTVPAETSVPETSPVAGSDVPTGPGGALPIINQ